MWKYDFLLCLVMMTAQLSPIESQSSFSEEKKPNLYKKLCYDPTELTSKIAFRKRSDLDPTKENWVVHLGNAAARLHFGSVLKGDALTNKDIYDDMCFTISEPYMRKGTTEIGYFHGFGRQRASTWNCKPSVDFSGVLRCNDISELPSKYQDDLYFYFTYTEKEDLYVTVSCFSNGEIGWSATSFKTTLTEAENEAVRNQVAALGFSTTDFVRMYGDGCNNNTTIERGVSQFKI